MPSYTDVTARVPGVDGAQVAVLGNWIAGQLSADSAGDNTGITFPNSLFGGSGLQCDANRNEPCVKGFYWQGCNFSET
jgi:hypothetical protein